MNNLPQFEVSNINLKPKRTTKSEIVHIPLNRMYSFLVIFSALFLLIIISLFNVLKENSNFMYKINNLIY